MFTSSPIPSARRRPHPWFRLGLVGAAVTATALATAGVVTAGDRAGFHGVFHETETGAGDPYSYDIHGAARMTIDSGGTTVKVAVVGLDPGKVYGSHLHNGSCADGGGRHYQDDEEGEDTPPNELWLTTAGVGLEPNPGGVAHGAGSATWQARTTGDMTLARSVVVHEPGGDRIACADLR